VWEGVVAYLLNQLRRVLLLGHDDDDPLTHSLTRERKREHDNEATGRATPKRAAHTERAKSRRELASSSSRDASAKQQADNNKRNKRSFFSFSLLVLVLLLVVQHLEHLVLGA